MFKQYAGVESLSCLLNEDKDFEPLPEPFRMQMHVIFHVTYSEYIKYVLSLTPDTDVKLIADIGLLRNLAATGSPQLYKYFLADMAFAILKEVYFAETYKMQATVILPAKLDVSKKTLLSEFVTRYNECRYVQNELLIYMNEKGFGIPKRIQACNERALQTAVILFCLSKQNSEEELNLEYDAP